MLYSNMEPSSSLQTTKSELNDIDKEKEKQARLQIMMFMDLILKITNYHEHFLLLERIIVKSKEEGVLKWPHTSMNYAQWCHNAILYKENRIN